MACRGKDIPGRPNNKTKAGGGRQVGRGRKGGGEGDFGLAVTRGRTRGGTIESCAFVYLCCSISRCCLIRLLLEHLDFFQMETQAFFFFFLENIRRRCL